MVEFHVFCGFVGSLLFRITIKSLCIKSILKTGVAEWFNIPRAFKQSTIFQSFSIHANEESVNVNYLVSLSISTNSSSIFATMRCCSASEGIGTDVTFTLSIFRLETVLPLALSQNCVNTYDEDKR